MARSADQVSNPGSALGEAVGKLIEHAVIGRPRTEVEPRGHSICPSHRDNTQYLQPLLTIARTAAAFGGAPHEP